MEADTDDAVHQPPASRAAQPRSRSRRSPSSCSLRIGSGVEHQGHRHLHPPVRDDDRRRSAARAVPRHPVHPGEQQRSSPRCSGRSRPTSSRAPTFTDALRRHPKVFDELFVNLVARRRDGRYPRHDPEPPRRLHREGDQAEAPGRARSSIRSRCSCIAGGRASPCCSTGSSRRSRRCSRTSAAASCRR